MTYDPVDADFAVCISCGEVITLEDVPAVAVGILGSDGMPRPGQAHRECMLRDVTGGIGHLIAHEYWCKEKDDPDGGLTKRQSALLASAYYRVVGPYAEVIEE